VLKSVNNFKLEKMKKTVLIILITFIIAQGFTQNLSAAKQENKNKEISLTKSEMDTLPLAQEAKSPEKVDTTLNLKILNRNLMVLESLEGQKITFDKTNKEEEIKVDTDIDVDVDVDVDVEDDVEVEVNYNNDYDDDNHRNSHRNRFKGHWSGIEVGFNNYVGSDNSNVLPDEINYMTLHSSKSTNFNINFAQLSLGFSNHTGLVTGLGINWNNYKFDGNNNIVKGPNGVIEELDPGAPLEKSKLATIYMTVPLLFEFQIPVENQSLNMAFGPIGALKLDSHTKMVYQDGNKVKSHGDFSLNIARYGFTARAGYGNFQLYGTYYMKPLFQTGKSPAGYDLFPCELGVAFTFND
jgi:hypothetical protein